MRLEAEITVHKNVKGDKEYGVIRLQRELLNNFIGKKVKIVVTDQDGE